MGKGPLSDLIERGSVTGGIVTQAVGRVNGNARQRKRQVGVSEVSGNHKGAFVRTPPCGCRFKEGLISLLNLESLGERFSGRA
jgi:hypothetical protein